MDKDVYPRVTAPCGEVVYTFVIANASALVQTGIQFYDPMPPGFEILEVVRNPFGGDVVNTGNVNELLIKDLTIPLGVDSIQVKVRIGDRSVGIYENQAILSELPESLGGLT